eukprot:Nk52_evm1s2176 gene=Nk52_evmTU1s2176
MRKYAQFTWTTEAQTAFDRLKDAVTSAPVLRPPDFSRPFILHYSSSSDSSETSESESETTSEESDDISPESTTATSSNMSSDSEIETTRNKSKGVYQSEFAK